MEQEEQQIINAPLFKLYGKADEILDEKNKRFERSSLIVNDELY